MWHNVDAVNSMVEAHKFLDEPRYAPMIHHALTLARQIDLAGDNPSASLSKAYLSILQHIDRTIRDHDPDDGKTRTGGKLAKFKAIYGVEGGRGPLAM